MDVHDKETRSFNMSQIKGKNTKPEMIIRKHLFSLGFRYTLHNKKLPGKPDLCFPKYKTVLFVHGCFWHAHEGCKYFKWPKTNTEFWKEKISGNVKRDNKHITELALDGWNVLIVWECELKKDKIESTLDKLPYLINSTFCKK